MTGLPPYGRTYDIDQIGVRNMPERQSYIPGVPCWVDTSHPDQEAVLPFYSGLFGWEFENVMPAGAPSKYFVGRIGGRDAAAIGSVPDGAPPMASWTTYVRVDSADDAAAAARSAGGEASEPFDVGEFGRMAVITDPEGATLCVWQPKRHQGAQVVNEHGALNFNGLATRDVAGAKAFYGALFGWQTLPLPSGEMWTLPAYGDHLEASTPGLREQMEQMGAPVGFVDVVAAINPIGEDDSVTPAHWSVTFGVDDAEATAAKVTSLGGEVVAGPFDAPWTKLVVIKDPQGATFIAGQFVIENKDLEA
jgi:predicted enzyme related to lactoylglutathione lyase